MAASVGLGLVLLASTGFTLFASSATTVAATRAEQVRKLSVLYSDARLAVITEESLEEKYRRDGGADAGRAHAAAARDFDTILNTIVWHQPAAKAAEARRLLQLHGRYLVAVHRMFAAVDAGKPARALAIEQGSVDPTFSAIHDRVFARVIDQGRVAAATFGAFASTQRQVINIAMALSVLGLLCLFGFLFVISAYRNRLIASHESEVQRIAEAALVDSLTKIGNHRAFKDDMQREMAFALRHKLELTLAMVDVDEFKIVNDQNGHVYGDGVLVELAEILSSSRKEDRAYRLGGDEFALILPGTSALAARPVLERVRVAVSNSLNGGTVSIGYSTLGEFDITAEALQNQADAALYLVKRGGRNGVARFDASDKGTSLLSTERVQSLRALLASGSLEVAFQPIWDLERGEILAFEALSRPPLSFGFEGPQDAFDLAERIGCAHELDRSSRMAALRRAADMPPDALLFLNISPQTLDRDFDIREFVASVEAFGLRPERVVIEITERSVAHLDNVIVVGRLLRSAGFRIALDDTGAGHAGLEIMSRLQFDYVKIDRAIIVKAMSDRSASGVVAAIVAFARVTGAYVIAEGIEDIEMLDFIDGTGRAVAPAGRGICGAQGYLLQRPSVTFPTAAAVQDVRALLSEHITDEATLLGSHA